MHLFLTSLLSYQNLDSWQQDGVQFEEYLAPVQSQVVSSM